MFSKEQEEENQKTHLKIYNEQLEQYNKDIVQYDELQCDLFQNAWKRLLYDN